jgi:cellulose synthase/poly-beta-1,6-N-acetylglucosamine synthase-like glycosyltransferase
MSENGWKLFLVIVIFLYLVTISTIIYFVVSGTAPLIDRSIDLYYITLPILVLALIYVSVSICIFGIYLVGYKKVKNKQLIAIQQRNTNKKYQYEISTKKTLLYEYRDAIASLNGNGRTQSLAHNMGMKEEVEEDLCSIIIAARNEDSVIGRTVNGCLEQTYKNIEVIVVCHNCTDRTFQEAQVNDPRVHAFDFRTKAAGKGIALNFGVENAKGKYLLVLDADGLLSRDFIEKAIPVFDYGYVAVQGRYIPSNRDYSFITKLLSIEGDLWSTPYSTTRALLDQRCGLGGTGYIIRKDVLMEVGGFANHLVDDYELTCRILKKKYRIGFAPLCINYDEKPPNLEIMLRQRARWAKGFLDLLKHKVIEATDILGFLLWIGPIAGFCGFIILTIAGFAAIYNLIFEYYPYYYASIHVDVWIALTATLYSVQALSLIRQYGRRGFKYAAYVPIYNVFSLYSFITLIKAFTVKSWASTKTTHGFLKHS